MRPPPWLSAALLALALAVAAWAGGGVPAAGPEAPASSVPKLPAATTTSAVATTSTTQTTSPPERQTAVLVVSGSRVSPSALTLDAASTGVLLIENRDDREYPVRVGTPEVLDLVLPRGEAVEVDLAAHPPGRYGVAFRVGAASFTATVDTTGLGADPASRCAAIAEVAGAAAALTERVRAAADRLAADDPATFLAEFRALVSRDDIGLAAAIRDLEGAWRAAGAEEVADWLAGVARSLGRARWPAELAAAWHPGEGVAASASAAAAGCAADPPAPGVGAARLLEALQGPTGFVAPPLGFATGAYEVRFAFEDGEIRQSTEYEAEGDVRATVEWELPEGQRAAEEIVATRWNGGNYVYARWPGQEWREVTYDAELSLAPVRAERSVPFGTLLDTLYAAANGGAAVRVDRHLGQAAHRYDLVLDEEQAAAVIDRLVGLTGDRPRSRVDDVELWVSPEYGYPMRAALTLTTPGYDEPISITWEFTSLRRNVAPIGSPRLGSDVAPDGYTRFVNRAAGWRADISEWWVPLEPTAAGSTTFRLPGLVVEVAATDVPLVAEWMLDGYEHTIGASGDVVSRHREAIVLGGAPAEKLDMTVDTGAGNERWIVIHATTEGRSYAITVMSLGDDAYIGREVDELIDSFEFLGDVA